MSIILQFCVLTLSGFIQLGVVVMAVHKLYNHYSSTCIYSLCVALLFLVFIISQYFTVVPEARQANNESVTASMVGIVTVPFAGGLQLILIYRKFSEFQPIFGHSTVWQDRLFWTTLLLVVIANIVLAEIPSIIALGIANIGLFFYLTICTLVMCIVFLRNIERVSRLDDSTASRKKSRHSSRAYLEPWVKNLLWFNFGNCLVTTAVFIAGSLLYQSYPNLSNVFIDALILGAISYQISCLVFIYNVLPSKLVSTANKLSQPNLKEMGIS
ncbi:uncharacterized protein BJ171DRAFT_565639 [Polychytrium aggregatum]|uniref:uncharacterized protein n=1 Tax=Polychytrium aggregatum TaxID=110093 RepID=UPI0022FE4266|nr:uncharacterized protein BJ171DRAFT_565639 [Polychytrium aggregatum]KAI9207891.1 hypothetical protein BJ171DRAFT_565639 [Polychytrium aggregatum]